MHTGHVNYSGFPPKEILLQRARTLSTIGLVLSAIGLAILVAGAISAVFIIGPGIMVIIAGGLLIFAGHRKTLEANRTEGQMLTTPNLQCPTDVNTPYINHPPILIRQQSSSAELYNNQQGSFVTSTYWVPGPATSHPTLTPTLGEPPPLSNVPTEPPPSYDDASKMK
uniref:uncharacterized protein LOC120330993 isoform X1 n=1 Tax=Styela clava TaxID=7725 RepID=UPI001939D31C|nr:uncharacterized protein LOC120330993 isoform X1 [Styela clava]XP_039253933.1 uncharacterized protein LOC120330993 isoform X2 [Styela clava]